MIGALFLMGGLYIFMQGLQANDQVNIFLGFLVLIFAFSFVNAAVRVPQQVPVFRTVTVAKCSKCEYAEVRDFQRGDYVYKALGKCKDCGSPVYARTIYAIPVQKTQLSSS
jgi:hypothetical protein